MPQVLTETGQWIDERSGWYKELLDLQGQLLSDFNYVTEGRRMLKEGPLSMQVMTTKGKNTSRKVQLFLMSDCLLVCDKRRQMTNEAQMLRQCFLKQVPTSCHLSHLRLSHLSLAACQPLSLSASSAISACERVVCCGRLELNRTKMKPTRPLRRCKLHKKCLKLASRHQI